MGFDVDRVWLDRISSVNFTKPQTEVAIMMVPDEVSASVAYMTMATGFVRLGSAGWGWDRPVTVYVQPGIPVEVIRVEVEK